jgi:malate dehydrogenase (oxaloacetate-decarboxylating)
MPLLNRYRDELCCFNDDIQGTAAVTVGTLLAACKAKGEELRQQRVVFAGAGSAGCGIAEQIIAEMRLEGLTDSEARRRIYMLNSAGLLQESSEGLRSFQKPLSTPDSEVNSWNLSRAEGFVGLIDVVANAKPTVLVGVSGQPGFFTKAIVETMHRHCERPVILPLSNPTSQVEALPVDILRWTGGQAIVATGSPFAPVDIGGRHHDIAQCNNAYIFPGVGLGVIASGASRITDNMMMASSRALAEASPMVRDGKGALLPSLDSIREVSKTIARAVFIQAVEDKVAMPVPEEMIDEQIARNFWEPEYRDYRRTSF